MFKYYVVQYTTMASNSKTELKKLSDYTTDEKIAWFDETYNDAMWYLVYLETHKYKSKYCEHYTFDWCMELLGENVWEDGTPWNNCTDGD